MLQTSERSQTFEVFLEMYELLMSWRTSHQCQVQAATLYASLRLPTRSMLGSRLRSNRRFAPSFMLRLNTVGPTIGANDLHTIVIRQIWDDHRGIVQIACPSHVYVEP